MPGMRCCARCSRWLTGSRGSGCWGWLTPSATWPPIMSSRSRRCSLFSSGPGATTSPSLSGDAYPPRPSGEARDRTPAPGDETGEVHPTAPDPEEMQARTLDLVRRRAGNVLGAISEEELLLLADIFYKNALLARTSEFRSFDGDISPAPTVICSSLRSSQGCGPASPPGSDWTNRKRIRGSVRGPLNFQPTLFSRHFSADTERADHLAGRRGLEGLDAEEPAR